MWGAAAVYEVHVLSTWCNIANTILTYFSWPNSYSQQSYQKQFWNQFWKKLSRSDQRGPEIKLLVMFNLEQSRFTSSCSHYYEWHYDSLSGFGQNCNWYQTSHLSPKQPFNKDMWAAYEVSYRWPTPNWTISTPNCHSATDPHSAAFSAPYSTPCTTMTVHQLSQPTSLSTMMKIKPHTGGSEHLLVVLINEPQAEFP